MSVLYLLYVYKYTQACMYMFIKNVIIFIYKTIILNYQLYNSCPLSTPKTHHASVKLSSYWNELKTLARGYCSEPGTKFHEKGELLYGRIKSNYDS